MGMLVGDEKGKGIRETVADPSSGEILWVEQRGDVAPLTWNGQFSSD